MPNNCSLQIEARRFPNAMQDGMQMMGGMSGAGMGAMNGMQGMTGDMGAHHQIMAKRMETMHTMMKMMMDRMPASRPAKSTSAGLHGPGVNCR